MLLKLQLSIDYLTDFYVMLKEKAIAQVVSSNDNISFVSYRRLDANKVRYGDLKNLILS